MQKFISSVDQVSHERAKRTKEISLSTREINFIFPSIHILLFCVLFEKNAPLPCKNSNHNAESEIIVACENITFNSGGKINKTLHFI